MKHEALKSAFQISHTFFLPHVLIESDDVDSNRKPGRKPMADEEALSDVRYSKLQIILLT